MLVSTSPPFLALPYCLHLLPAGTCRGEVSRYNLLSGTSSIPSRGTHTSRLGFPTFGLSAIGGNYTIIAAMLKKFRIIIRRAVLALHDLAADLRGFFAGFHHIPETPPWRARRPTSSSGRRMSSGFVRRAFPLRMLEFAIDADGNRGFRLVEDHDDLKKNGEIMTAIVRAANAIPSSQQRHCTQIMKIETLNRFADSVGARRFNNLLGLRADEPRRLARMKAANEHLEAWQDGERDCRLCAGTGKDAGAACPRCGGDGKMRRPRYRDTKIMPLAERGVVRQDVIDFWRGDHGLKGLSFEPGDDGVHLSNCVGCFFGGSAAVWKTFKERPDLAKVWEDLEQSYGLNPNTPPRGKISEERVAFYPRHLGRPIPEHEKQRYTFHKGHSWADFREFLDRVRRGEDAPLFGAMLAESESAGGCGDGFCDTDL